MLKRDEVSCWEIGFPRERCLSEAEQLFASSCSLLPALQVLLESLPGHTVNNALFLHPGSTGLRDAELGEAQSRLVVGIGIYRDLHACADGLPDVGDGEV